MRVSAFALVGFLFSFAAQAQMVRLNGGNAAGGAERKELARAATGERRVEVRFAMRKMRVRDARNGRSAVQVDNLPLTSEPGFPALPFQAVTLDAAAADVRVAAELGAPVTVKVGRLAAAQPEPCRCAAPPPAAVDKVSEYRPAPSGFLVQSLGDFRGRAMSRVVLTPHRYDSASGTLTVYPNARFVLTAASAVAPESAPLYDYLVITPRALMGGLANWVDWKRTRQGLRFNVVAYEDIGSPNTDQLKAWIHEEYARAQFKYALLVGGRAQIPQQTVATSTDPNTPSDLPYFTMGGADDVIPDVLAGRVVADNADTVARVLEKWIAYERDATPNPGWARDIGIASNQGASPSDAEYVGAIQDKLKAAFGANAIYLYQSSADSNPANFNNQLAGGAMWVTYVGHGSGTSWPSFGQTYSVANVQQLRNANAVKPVWIDVACLNGALENGAAGASLTVATDPGGHATGVTAYLGGTVLVSWHPPAIFARGVAFKVAEMVSPVLGDAIQAGQRYLTENTSNLFDIQSNQRWYHLQGDPSLRLRLK